MVTRRDGTPETPYKYFYRANTLVRPTSSMLFTGAVASYRDLKRGVEK
jgi:hypothetical protein